MRLFRWTLIFSTLLACNSVVTSAIACSVGPGNPDEAPFIAERVLRDSDVVAEVEVVSLIDSSARRAECTARIEAASKRCENGKKDAFCKDFIETYMEDCWPSGEATVEFTTIWKGQVSGPMTMLYVTPYDDICGWGMVLEVGRTIEICGDIDGKGRLQAGWCWTDAQYVFDRYRDKWHELKNAVHDKPHDIGARIKLAEFYDYWNDRRGAINAYADICDMAQDNALGCAGAGRVLFGQERYAEAVPYLQKAFDRDPANRDNENLLQRARFLTQE